MIGTGAAILLSQERGAGNHATANRAFCCMILAEIVVGALFAALLIPVLPAVLRGLGATPELFGGAYRYSLILVSTSMLPMLAMGCIAVMRNDGSRCWRCGWWWSGWFQTSYWTICLSSPSAGDWRERRRPRRSPSP